MKPPDRIKRFPVRGRAGEGAAKRFPDCFGYDTAGKACTNVLSLGPESPYS